MLKRSLLIFLVLIAAAVCYAQTSDKPADTAQAGLTENKQINGTIDKIDHKKMMLSIKNETTKANDEFSFTSSTTFSKDGLAVTAKDLKKGDRVSLEVDSANMILKVDVVPKESTQEQKDSEKPE